MLLSVIKSTAIFRAFQISNHWKKNSHYSSIEDKTKMEIVSVPISSCSKEDQKIYQNWFDFVDSGTIFRSFCYEQLFVFYIFGDIWAVYRYVFWIWYADGDGRITGNDAIKLFSLSNLSRPELKQVVFFCSIVLIFVKFLMKM